MNQRKLFRETYDVVITRTIYEYYLDRSKELRILSRLYINCTDIQVRRQIRSRKSELVTILNRATSLTKASLQSIVGSYIEVDKYPNLIEIKRKQLYLKRSLL